MDNEDLKRESTNVPLSPAARRMIENLREETGIPKVEAIQRYCEWLERQDRKFRLAILLRDEAAQQEFSRLVLQQMIAIDGDEAAAELAKKFSIPAATRMIRALCDRIDQADADRGVAINELTKGKSKKG